MAWFSGRMTLGNFPDFSGAVNKISESVKNIEKNFDNALGLEDQPGGSRTTIESSRSWPPELMAFMGQTDDNGTVGSSKKHESSERNEPLNSSSVLKEKEEVAADDSANTTEERLSAVREASVETSKPEEHHVFYKEKEGIDADDSTNTTEELLSPVREASVETSKPEEHEDHPEETNIAITEEADSNAEKPMGPKIIICDQADGTVALPNEAENIAEKHVETNIAKSHEATTIADNHSEVEADSQAEPNVDDAEESVFQDRVQCGESSEVESSEISGSIEDQSANSVDQIATTSPELNEVHTAPNLQKSEQYGETTPSHIDASYDGQAATESEPHGAQSPTSDEGQLPLLRSSDEASEMVPEVVSKDNNENAKVHIVNQPASDDKTDVQEQRLSLANDLSDNTDSGVELEKAKREMKKMEAALVGAARQAQAKADEIAKLMNENEQLKSIIEYQRRKSNEAEIESLREEYHQRVSTLERKVYALTRERDTLRREQNKKNDATALLKEKDEIITQVMAEVMGVIHWCQSQTENMCDAPGT